MFQFNSNIYLIHQNVLQYLVNSVKFHCIHSVFKILLIVSNDLSTSIASADRSLFIKSINSFEYPHALRALVAEKLFAWFTVVSNIFEVKFALTSFVSAIFSWCCFLNQFFNLWLCGQIERRMPTSILYLYINTSRKEAFKHFLRTARSCLMHSSITMHVNVKRTHGLLQKDPNDFIVTFVTGPRKRSVFSDLLCIFRFNERVVFLFNTSCSSLSLFSSSHLSRVRRICNLIQVRSACIMFDKHSHNIFIAVISRP